MPYTCPYCKAEFFRQKNCVEHARECGNRLPDTEPARQWVLNEMDKRLLRSLRILPE